MNKNILLIYIFLFPFYILLNGQTPALLGFEPWYVSQNLSCLDSCFTRSYMDSRAPRLVANLNKDWTFSYQPSENLQEKLVSVEYNDKVWQAVAIPHTWMTYETTGDLHPFIKNASETDDSYWWKGWGYYRKHFKIDSNLKQKKVFLELDGVQKYCRIYLNGSFIAEHKGGFNSFSIDLTSKVNWTNDNILTVAVNGYRRDKFGIPPMNAGNWDVYSGIYRDVRLVLKNKIFIPYQGDYDYEGGTFVTTPIVTNDSANVNIKTFVRNDTPNLVNCIIQTLIEDKDGKLICSIEKKTTLPILQTTCIDQISPTIKNPKLWSPNSPNLYKVISKILVSNKVQDTYESVLGFRWFKWDYSTNNLYINGKKINIKGINRHQEYPWLGDAIPKWISIEDMKDIKYGLGMNFMRTAHYSQDPLIYDFNNQNGIITVEEVPNIKNIDFNREIQEQNLRQMIRRDRNNPCILFWSMGNETNHGADSRWAWEEDKTRIIHARKAEDTGDFVQHTDLNLDMENLLRVSMRGWFDSDDMPSDVERNPLNGQVAGSNAWQHARALIPNGSIRGDLNNNCVAWVYQDHGADRTYKNYPLKNINAKGWVDSYRIPKYIYYLTRANYQDTPMVFVQPHFWRKKYIGQHKDFIVDSNCEEIELYVNEKSKGILKLNKEKYNSVSFPNITVEEGTMRVEGRNKGKTVCSYILKMPGDPYRIILKSSSDKIESGRNGIAIITAYIVDRNGNLVFDASNKLTWSISGKGNLIGPKVYETDKDKIEETEGTAYDVVPVSNVIRSTNQSGEININVSASGLIAGKLSIISFLPQNKTTWLKQPSLNDEFRLKPIKENFIYQDNVVYKKYIIDLLSANTIFEISDEERLKQEVSSFVKKRNPKLCIESTTPFSLIIDQLIMAIKRMNGVLIGDDYNFILNQYNLYLNIAQVIQDQVLNITYDKLLKDQYAIRILKKNEQLDFTNETKYIKSLPKKYKVYFIKEPDIEHKDEEIIYDNVSHSYTYYSIKPIKEILLNISNKKAYTPEEKVNYFERIAEISPFIIYNKKEGEIRFASNDKMIILPF